MKEHLERMILLRGQILSCEHAVLTQPMRCIPRLCSAFAVDTQLNALSA